MELWLPCNDFEGYYEISNYGRVRSVRRLVSFTDNKPDRFIRTRILKLQVDKLGYIRVRFCINQYKTTHKVHRLVAKAFIPNPENKPQVNHKDGIKSNNLYTNLEWNTNLENQYHALRNGLRIHGVGINSARFSGQVHAFDASGTLIASMAGNKEMATYGFDYRLVSGVLKGKRKTHKGCTFIKSSI